MKKVLFTMILSLAFCGSIFAQHESHWSDFYNPNFEQHGNIFATVAIDDNMILPTDNYYDYEVGFFVGDECRGHGFLHHYEGDTYPMLDFESMFYDPDVSSTDEVSFRLYDHINQFEYTYCLSSETVIVSHDYSDWDNPVQLYFYHTFTKEIDPYTVTSWYLIASPLNEAVNAENVLGLRTPNFDFYSFNQSAEDGLEWINLRDDAEYQLQPGIGYLYANSTGEDLTFVGAPYEGAGEVTLAYDANAEFPGWNLVGNPFAQTAYIDRSEFYVMNNGTEIIPAENNEIPAMEGIFVVATGANEKVTFSTTDPNTGKGQIVLNVTNNDRGNAIDRAIVRFGQGGTLPKFMLNPNNTKLYIAKDNKDFAVVRTNKSGKVSVNFEPSQDGTYAISGLVENIKNIRYLHLIDNLTGDDIDLLRNPNYRFDAKKVDRSDRFDLVFSTNVFSALSTKDGDSDSFGFCNNGNWIINNEGDAVLQVIDVNGRILCNEEISGSVSKRIDAAPGVYMLRLINNNDVKVQKIVVE